MEIEHLIVFVEQLEIGIADAFCSGARVARPTSTEEQREVICDDTQCTLRILAQLLPPRDLTALPTTRARDAGNRNVERSGSCRMHSRLQGWPTLE
jgi:hypothetical protein